MILEGLVTTINADGSTNVSPMGPLVTEYDFQSFILRPFQTSTTFANLKRCPQGVLHVTDDVGLIAEAAIGRLSAPPATRLAEKVEGRILVDACRWYAFRVESWDEDQPRASIGCAIVDAGRIRDFWGFCRGKHAVIEAAILAMRTAFVPAAEIKSRLKDLAVIVDKTGGTAERRAFSMLDEYIRDAFGKQGIE